MGWSIDPRGMTDLLLRISRDYPGQPMMITENGAAFNDLVSADGRGARCGSGAVSARPHHAVGVAIDAGADVRGCFVWLLLDNFEWAYGFDP